MKKSYCLMIGTGAILQPVTSIDYNKNTWTFVCC